MRSIFNQLNSFALKVYIVMAR